MAEPSTAIEWDDAALDAAVKRVAADGVIEAVDVRLSAEQLAALLNAAPRSKDTEQPILDRADFSYATFSGDASFAGATFSGDASFAGATFIGAAGFRDASFSGDATFDYATFNEKATFFNATFREHVSFDNARFSKGAAFREASFGGHATFDTATFNENATFINATFREHVLFDNATFSQEASFREASFSGPVYFDNATFYESAIFFNASFRERVSFEDATFNGNFSCSEASFSGSVLFDDATFNGDVSCGKASFSGSVLFDDATFSGDASFAEASFSGDASFDDATFSRDVSFLKTSFRGDASFQDATFSQEASFRETSYSGSVHFDNATFNGDVSFLKASLSGDARFDDAAFSGSAGFVNARFEGDAAFGRVTFRRDARFDRASFDRSGVLGPMHVFDRLWLDGAVFAERVFVEASARRVSCARTVFRGGSAIRLRWAELWLEDTEFAGPSLVEGLRPQHNPDGDRGFLGWEKPEDDGAWTTALRTPPQDFEPRLLSMRDARVAQLALAGIDLRRCQFARAKGLDELAYEGADFGRPPAGWRWIRWRPVRWTRRRTIVEEHQWRAARVDKYGSGWDLGDGQEADEDRAANSNGSERPAPWPPEAPVALGGHEVADVYRELRKGREDKKDEPGAADFYYGEMEMRRHSAPLAERTILWLYWMVSGYGLRASRALLALAVTIGLGALLLQQFGFDAGKQPDDGTLLFAVESSISLFRAPEGELTAAGHVIQIVLRLAGPLFFGLALLALRGRVKR